MAHPFQVPPPGPTPRMGVVVYRFAQNHAKLEALLAGITDEEAEQRPEPGAWTVAEHVQFAREIDKSGRMLLSLVNDIIDVTRLEGGSIAIDVDEIETSVAVERREVDAFLDYVTFVARR